MPLNFVNKTVQDLSFLDVEATAEVAQKGSWQNLFDGKSLSGWHLYNNAGEPIKNWLVEGGALVCLGTSGGDIVTDKQYENFELEWKWKIEKGSNSGVMYHVVENSKYKATYATGPEYQIIDDIAFGEKLEAAQTTGSDYAMTPAITNKKLMPVGDWNTSKIIFNKGQVEHWLNGEKIVSFRAWSDDWNNKRLSGKWKDYPDYGKSKIGVIAFQNHSSKAYFRDIRIKPL